MQYLFVYGTLCFKKIVEKLTNKTFEFKPAVLFGYQRRLVKGYDYPAIVDAPGEKTEGFIIKNSDEKSLNILSFYEGEDYRKENVTVFIENEKIDAITFIWQKSVDLLDEKDWDIMQFEKESLKEYLEKIIPDTIDEYTKINCSE